MAEDNNSGDTHKDRAQDLIKYAHGFNNAVSRLKIERTSGSYWGASRLLKDLNELENASLDIIGGPSEYSIYKWNISFPAPNGKYVKAELHFDSTYPLKAPMMFIKQRLFHPNVSLEGRVCLQDLENIWTPAHSVWSVILSVQCLLSDPNPEDPINAVAAQMLREDPEMYNKYATQCFEMLEF